MMGSPYALFICLILRCLFDYLFVCFICCLFVLFVCLFLVASCRLLTMMIKEIITLLVRFLLIPLPPLSSPQSRGSPLGRQHVNKPSL